jgi:hypothetical protein
MTSGSAEMVTNGSSPQEGASRKGQRDSRRRKSEHGERMETPRAYVLKLAMQLIACTTHSRTRSREPMGISTHFAFGGYPRQ